MGNSSIRRYMAVGLAAGGVVLGAACSDTSDVGSDTSCTVAENGDGSSTITCPDGTSAQVGASGSAPGGVGSQGDLCLSTGDCASGYRCRNTGVFGNCIQEAPAFDVFTTVCVEDQCEVDADCGATLMCSSGACRCANDADCQAAFLGMFCESGSCVNCKTAFDCGASEICADGSCQVACQSDASCPAFYTCNAGECVHGGCTSNRECVRGTADARAVCDTASSPGLCRIPCDGEFACNNGTAGYNFLTCSGGYCVPIGCKDDAECEACVSSPGPDPVCDRVTPATSFAVHCVDASSVN